LALSEEGEEDGRRQKEKEKETKERFDTSSAGPASPLPSIQM
jgi:hypothetical protein